MTTHVSDNTALMSSLLYNLNGQLDELERCQEMIARLSAMESTRKVPKEVIDYICSYSDLCKEALEGFGSDSGGVWNTIKNILGAIKNAIVKIIKVIVEAFRYLFDTQYRHRKQFLDINKNLMVLASNPENVKRFESIPCSVIHQRDAIDVIEKSTSLVNMIRFVATCNENKAIDDLLTQFSKLAAVEITNDTFTDKLASLAGQKYSSFKDAGWTLAGLQECTKKHIDSISGVETLKSTKSALEKDIGKLERQVNDAMQNNVPVESVQYLQKTTAMKIRIVRIIGNAIQVLNNRSNGITNILKAINAEASRIMKS